MPPHPRSESLVANIVETDLIGTKQAERVSPARQEGRNEVSEVHNVQERDVSCDSTLGHSGGNRFSPLDDQMVSPIEAYDSSTSERRAALLHKRYESMKQVALQGAMEKAAGHEPSMSEEEEQEDSTEDEREEREGDNREDTLFPSFEYLYDQNNTSLMAEPIRIGGETLLMGV